MGREHQALSHERSRPHRIQVPRRTGPDAHDYRRQGASYPEIASALGVSVKRAIALVSKAIAPSGIESPQQTDAFDAERINTMIHALSRAHRQGYRVDQHRIQADRNPAAVAIQNNQYGNGPSAPADSSPLVLNIQFEAAKLPKPDLASGFRPFRPSDDDEAESVPVMDARPAPPDDPVPAYDAGVEYAGPAGDGDGPSEGLVRPR
jgi:hypothetical protein